MKATADQTKRYRRLVQKQAPPKPLLKNLVLAFLIGGVICTIGQVILQLLVGRGMTPEIAASPTSALMIAIGALVTGLGFYDELGRYGGMGAALPITGFANSIVSPAMEFKREGFILGVGAKMFVIAGPVIVYGLVTAVVAAAAAYALGVRVP